MTESHPSAPSVSVVIPTRNGGPLFRHVLSGLRAQRYAGPVEVVVVDSGSSDGTPEAAAAHGARVEHIRPEDFDHGLTRNHGISLSTGEVVILMSQDAEPADHSLIRNLAAAFEDPRIGGAYARQLPRFEADVLTKRNLIHWLTGGDVPKVRELPAGGAFERMSPWEKYTLCTFDNVCSSIRRKAWEAVPFRRYEIAEDNEWCLRALRAGWKIAYQPKAAVRHSHDRSVFYEYKRTYMCHRKLYELFRLQCVPTFRSAVRSAIRGTIDDWRYVLANEPILSRRLALLARVPALSAATVLAQYRGARDERRGSGRKLGGV